MKIIDVKPLRIPDVKIIRFEKFTDYSGYFLETYRKSEFDRVSFLRGLDFVQANESFLVTNVLRGLHCQWHPSLGKLVRMINGCFVDIFLDLRAGSPWFGQADSYLFVPYDKYENISEWIWIPPGFAHGIYMISDTRIQYFYTGECNPLCEAGINPFDKDIQWMMSRPFVRHDVIMSDKDKNAMGLKQWVESENAQHFQYSELKGQSENV